MGMNALRHLHSWTCKVISGTAEGVATRELSIPDIDPERGWGKIIGHQVVVTIVC